MMPAFLHWCTSYRAFVFRERKEFWLKARSAAQDVRIKGETLREAARSPPYLRKGDGKQSHSIPFRESIYPPVIDWKESSPGPQRAQVTTKYGLAFIYKEVSDSNFIASVMLSQATLAPVLLSSGPDHNKFLRIAWTCFKTFLGL